MSFWAATQHKLSNAMSLKQLYLVAYNCAMALGWALATCAALPALLGVEIVHPSALTHLVCLLQAAATVEIVHSAVGIVKGSPVSAFIQNGGRDAVLFLFILPVQHAHSSLFVYLLYAVWGLAEVIRYPYYVALLLGSCPDWLKTLRYSAFLVLYPLGMFGELASAYVCYQDVASQGWYSVSMPNAANVAFSFPLYWAVHVVLGYTLGGPYMYKYMLKQRAKQLKPHAV